MKRTLSIAIFLTLMLSTAQLCRSQPGKPTAQPALAQSLPPAQAASGGYSLIEARGEVLVHRVGDENLRRVSVNAQINAGDLVIVRKGASATVRCADGRTWKLPEGVSGILNGCQPPNHRSPTDADARSPLTEDSPYILSPRQTALLNEQPVLRWNPVPGAQRYTVKVRDAGGVKWQTQVTSPQVVYSGSPLQPGGEYQVIVRADRNSSDLESAIFWVLDEQTARIARDRLEGLAQQGLSEPAEALAKAHVYSTYGLFADAIETLEGLVAHQKPTPAVYQMLGALYNQVGLTQEAERYYSQAFATGS